MRLNLPLLPDPKTTVERWGPELRSYDYFLESEFTWINWQPTYSVASGGSASYAWINVITDLARYALINDTVFINVKAFGNTTGAVVRSGFRFTLPFPAKVQASTASDFGPGSFSATVLDGGSMLAGSAVIVTPSLGFDIVEVRRFDAATFGAGANRAMFVSGHYRRSFVS